MKSHVQQRAEGPAEKRDLLTDTNNMQMGEDDERPNGQASQAGEPEIDADTVAHELWRTVGFGCASSLPECLHLPRHHLLLLC